MARIALVEPFLLSRYLNSYVASLLIFTSLFDSIRFLKSFSKSLFTINSSPLCTRELLSTFEITLARTVSVTPCVTESVAKFSL
uniref:Uncharacterized protein n=1 Tax=Bacillus thuringiensis subsp. israelensis TaxID=1430 RepID=A0A2I6SWH9_BACTI|nr:hypothetical protein [Bacillus thuringiensis serovar israelensis]